MATAITIQYSGIWTMQQVNAAIAASTWPVVPPNGYLYMWGKNTQGTLGLGNTTNYSSPKQVGSLNSWTVVAGGTDYTIALKSDGTLWSWGYNNVGQLGLGNRTSYSSPKQVGVLTAWSKVACAGSCSFAVKTDGTLWSWGSNNNGQLGLNNTTNYSSPKQVGSLTAWSKVFASGDDLGFAIKTDGTFWAWGVNNQGQLGHGNLTYYSSPKQVGALTNWASISNATQNATIAVKTDGTLWAWGRNQDGQLGLGNLTNYSSPKQVGALTAWSKPYGGNSFTGAIKTDGTLWMWGNGQNGQLGLGNLTKYSSPKQVGSLTIWTSLLVTLSSSTIGLRSDGTLWSWGSGGAGTLGLGNISQFSSPQQIGALSNWRTLAVSAYDGSTIGAIAV